MLGGCGRTSRRTPTTTLRIIFSLSSPACFNALLACSSVWACEANASRLERRDSFSSASSSGVLLGAQLRGVSERKP